ncbi:MAG: preprotein translocase subunit SecE [Deltaproteobacteria bacterium]|nr:preprotein translocase subunit SecE [Deltaproteobacteria bacterium]
MGYSEYIGRAKQFFSDARLELKKVTWPTRQQTMTSTWVVLAVTAVLSIFLGLVDLAFSKVIGYILK